MVERSYSIAVRDAMMQRIKAMEYFRSFHFGTNKSQQIQPQSLPFCGVYFIEENGLPDGDANAGETRFRLSTRYGFSVIVLNNDGEESEYQLDAAYVTITRGLFNDPTLYNWARTADSNGDVVQVQAFTRGNRVHQFGSTGADNELPIAELRFDMTCDLGVETHPPIVTDDFERLHIEAAPVLEE